MANTATTKQTAKPNKFRDLAIGDIFERDGLAYDGLRYVKTGKITYRLCCDQFNYTADDRGMRVRFVRSW